MVRQPFAIFVKMEPVTNSTGSTITNATVADPFADVIYNIKTFFMPALTIGIPANILVIIVFSSKEFSMGISSVLFRILAVLDTYIVIVNVWFYAIPELLGFSIVKFSSVSCKSLISTMLWARCMSGWTLVFIAVERAVGMTWPHRVQIMLTKKVIYTLLVVSGLLSAAFFSPLIVSTELDTFATGQTFCRNNAHLHTYSIHIFPYLEPLLNTILPFALLLVCNSLIILAVRRSRMLQETSCENPQSNTLSHIAPMLLTASFVFMILRIPQAVYLVLENLYRSMPQSMAYRFVGFLSFFIVVLDTVNHSINMFLYSISGARFRGVIVSYFLCDKCRKT